MSMIVRPQDRCSFNSVFIQRQYGLPLPWATARVIIDIGANIGSFTVFASQLAPQAHIYAYEPEPSNYQQLVLNIGRNNLPATPMNAGVLCDDREMTLFVSSHHSGWHSAFHTSDGGVPVSVSVQNIHRVLAGAGGHCDILKVDCEGAEYEIFNALSASEWQQIGSIVCEYHHITGYDPEGLRQLFRAHDFSVSEPLKQILLALRA